MKEQPAVVAVLRDWRKHVCGPEGAFVIWGHIYDDAQNRFYDGQFIHTAMVSKIEGNLVYTKNNVYRLEGEAVGPAYDSAEVLT